MSDTQTTSNDWRERSWEFPVRFEDWLDTLADPGLEYVGEDVQRHAWHLDQEIYSTECKWCANRENGGENHG